jgi:hypothetical protein
VISGPGRIRPELSRPATSAQVADVGALTGVRHGTAGWLAVGAPGPAVFTSADGTAWLPARPIADDLAGVSAVTAAAGRAGYVIAGNIPAPGGASMPDVWSSPNLTSWTRARDLNDANGSSQVLAVAAGLHGFVSAGSHDGKPAVWTSANGRSWIATVLPLPGAPRLAYCSKSRSTETRSPPFGHETTAAGSVPFAEVSADGGAGWILVPLRAPGPGVTFTALTADVDGFTAAAQFGSPGRQQVAIWASASGRTWMRVTASGLNGLGPGDAHQIDALAPSGRAVTGVASITTQQGQRLVRITLPAR